MTNKIFKFGFFALIAVIIVILSFKGSTEGDDLYLDELESKVKSLNVINSRLEDENSIISTQLEFKMDSISVLKSEVAEIEYKKILLTKYYEKKIRAIDKLNVSQLDSVFANRYGR